MNGRRNLFIAVLVIIMVVVGAYFVRNKASGSSAYSSNTTGQNVTSNTVKYTDSGFSPNVITVKVGTTVTWVNNASDNMWVASNPHPTHTDLPGFDAKREIKPGETYSFTFTTVGSHGYHNHLNHVEGGTVVVE